MRRIVWSYNGLQRAALKNNRNVSSVTLPSVQDDSYSFYSVRYSFLRDENAACALLVAWIPLDSSKWGIFAVPSLTRLIHHVQVDTIRSKTTRGFHVINMNFPCNQRWTAYSSRRKEGHFRSNFNVFNIDGSKRPPVVSQNLMNHQPVFKTKLKTYVLEERACLSLSVAWRVVGGC
jgi:tricorn protease-like protein